jgi:hypothetical protein
LNGFKVEIFTSSATLAKLKRARASFSVRTWVARIKDVVAAAREEKAASGDDTAKASFSLSRCCLKLIFMCGGVII